MRTEQTQRARRLSALLPEESAFDLATAVSVDFVQEALHHHVPRLAFESVETVRVRYHAGKSCTALFAVSTSESSGSAEWLFHLRSMTARDYRATKKRLEGRSWVPGPHLNRPVCLDDRQSVLCEFPHDLELPELQRWLQDTDRSGERARVRSLLRYKPWRRAIFRLSGPDGSDLGAEVIRFANAKRFSRCLQLQQLADATLSQSSHIGSAPVREVDLELGCFSRDWVEGPSMSTALRKGSTTEAIERSVKALCFFHALPAASVPEVDPESIQRTVLTELNQLDGYPPRIRAAARRLSELLVEANERVPASRFGLVHGDFHPGQVVDGGDRPYLLDFEQMHVGDQDEDVGELAAQLRTRAIKQRVGVLRDASESAVLAYSFQAGRPIDMQRVALWTSLGLAKAALKELRGLRERWPENASALLDEAVQTWVG